MGDSRRSFVLLAVLVVIAGAILVATMLVQFAGAESAVAVASADRARSRALAFSGVAAILSELDGERDQILRGRSVELDTQYVLYEGELESGVVRLLPPGAGRELVVPVGGLLDVNRATSAELVATGLIDPAVADAIQAAREARPDGRFRTLEDLLEVELPDGTAAISPEQLLGPLEEIEPSKDVLAVEGDRGDRALDALDIRGDVTLMEVLTVYSFEPALQGNGVLRINLNVPYSEELGRRMDARFGEGTGDGLRQVMEQVEFDDDGKIVDILRLFNAEPKDWVDVMDALSSDERWHHGRIDLNTAPVEAVQSLEGIDATLADAIVNERDSLTSEELATRVWPVLRGIVEPEAFGPLASKVTTRCWIWRIRLAAGTVSVDDPDGPIQSPVVLDLVVDLAAPVPRIASLRDITGFEVGIRLLGDRSEQFGGREIQRPEASPDEDPDDGTLFGSSESAFDDSSFLDDVESAFEEPSVFDDFESAFDREDPPSEGTTEAPGSEGEGGGTSRPGGTGPRGRWSPR